MNLSQLKARLKERSEAALRQLPPDFIEKHDGEAVVTVVILSHHRVDFTLLAIQALKEGTRIPIDVLVIDNGSGEETQSILGKVAAEDPSLRLICLSQNLGCAGGRSFALSHINTEFVLFLDNDIEIMPGAVEQLLLHIESRPSLSAASGKVILPSGSVHICGGDYQVRDGVLTFELLGWKKPFDDPSLGESQACRWVNGGFTIMRTQLLLKHPYDPAMSGYYEDLEWCYRLKEQGIGSFCCVVDALGIHYHEPKHVNLLTDALGLDSDAENSAIACIEAIAHFYQVHGLVIAGFLDFFPELGPISHPTQLTACRITLEMIDSYGGRWVTGSLKRGRETLKSLLESRVERRQARGNSLSGALLPVAGPLIDVLFVQLLEQSARQRAIEALVRQVDEQNRRIAGLVAIVDQQQRTSRALEQSRAYRLANLVWKTIGFVKRAIRSVYRQSGQTNGAAPTGVDDDLGDAASSGDGSGKRREIPRAGAEYDVICFPIIDWDFRFQRPQQLATQYANAGHRVFYLSTTFHQGGVTPRIETIASNIYGVQLRGKTDLIIYQHRPDEDALQVGIECLEKLRRQAGIDVAVCLVQLPFWGPLAEEARRRWGWKVIYDCMDCHSGFSTNEPAMLQLEDDLIRSSDLVIATARLLLSKAERLGARALFLPNAADYKHFSAPSGMRMLEGLYGPVVGYYGAISDWFDIDLVRFAALAKPEWNFVLIGSSSGVSVESLDRLPNVHLLGEQPYAVLPDYLARFDVAIIPFRKVPLTDATNPVKFYEYLSAGKPVVSVDLPELESYQDYFHVARSPQEFVDEIEAALQEPSGDATADRMRLAKTHTWESRFKELKEATALLFPRVVIIIVSYNNVSYLKQCLESIWDKTAYPNFDVVVVDNHSEPQVIDYLESRLGDDKRLKVIFNSSNVGFAAANNIGIRAAGDCEHLVLLNDDTIVTRGWLERLSVYLADPEIGLVGPVTNTIGNEARITVDYSDLSQLDTFASRYTTEHEGLSFDIPMLAMYCVAFRKRLLDEVGFLDERFTLGMFEDDDYSLRVREAGYRIVCAEDVFVHHWGGASFKRLDPSYYQSLFDENKRKFEAKWGRKWIAHSYRDGVTDS